MHEHWGYRLTISSSLYLGNVFRAIIPRIAGHLSRRFVYVILCYTVACYIIVYMRLTFVSDTFDGNDRYNGGFLHGSRTSDILFVLNGLMEKQMLLGKSLLVCFVDFSKAFDVINRNILFHKLVNGG